MTHPFIPIAAAKAHTTLSAEAEVCHRLIVTIPAEDWEAFEAWLGRPAETIAPLVERTQRQAPY
jgi:hypothetical protein